MKKKQLTTEKRLGVQLYLVLFLYTVTGIGLEILAQFIFPKFDSKILSWLYWRIDMIFIFYLIIGFVCIFNYFWKNHGDIWMKLFPQHRQFMSRMIIL